MPLAILLALPARVHAQVSYEAGIGLRYDDNVNLSDDAAVEDTILFGSLRFVAQHDSPRLELRSRGNLRYLNYLGGTFDDQIRGEASGQLDWTIIPNRLHWVAEDYISRQAISVLLAPNPANQQEVNVFVTGPSLLMRLGSVTRAQLDLRYIDNYAQDSESFNGDRMVAKARIVRELSPTTNVSFNLEAANARFEESTLATDYKRYDAYFGLKRSLPAITFNVDLGYSQLKPENSDETDSSLLLRSWLDWRPKTRMAFTARIDYQFFDASQYLIRRSSELASESSSPTITSGDLLDIYDSIGNAHVVVDSDAYRERRIDLGYRYSGERLDLRLHPYVQRVRYETNLSPITNPGLDRNGHGAAVAIDYRLRREMSVELIASNENVHYPTLNRDDRDFQISLALADRSSRRWRWRAELSHGLRNSSTPNRSFSDNAISFFVFHRR